MRLRDLDGKSVVVWGWGREGRAARRLLEHHGRPAAISVIDDQDLPSDAEVRRGADATAALAAADVILKSPGIPMSRALRAGKPVTGGTQLWFAETVGAATIGVTGSKGKSTTSTLIAHLLEAMERPVTLAGNVGLALLDVLDADMTAAADMTADAAVTHALEGRGPGHGWRPAGPAAGGRWNVLELSSFQCAEVEHSPEVGVLTALFPEHLDWHGSLDRYYSDKINLFRHRGDITTIVNAENATIAARLRERPAELRNVMTYGTSAGLHPVGDLIVDCEGEPVVSLAACALVGRHNAVNLCGALTAARAVGVDITDPRIQIAIDSFRPLDHRLQAVGSVDGRLVIDDGLSTAPQAAMAALAAYPDRPLSIIVGGHDRGLDYDGLASAIVARTEPTWVMGVPETGARIVERITATARLDQRLHVHAQVFGDFDDAVRAALDLTPSGGVILLSPAAPSFGRFRDYKDRSQHFRSLVGLA